MMQMGVQQPTPEIPSKNATPDNFDIENANQGTPQEQLQI